MAWVLVGSAVSDGKAVACDWPISAFSVKKRSFGFPEVGRGVPGKEVDPGVVVNPGRVELGWPVDCVGLGNDVSLACCVDVG